MNALFSSYELGGVKLANRFVFPPIKTALGNPGGGVTEAHLNFYRNISDNGPGLIILEPVAVTADGREHPRQLQITGDGSVTELKKIVDVIHSSGRKACLHLNHAGAAANPRVIGGRPGSCSSFTCPAAGAEAEALPISQIESIIAAFGSAAQKAGPAGFDFIELQAGHGYLVAQFLNPKLNARDDEYGKDRFLLARKVIKAAADNSGGLPLIIRVSGSEMAPDKSLPPEDVDKVVNMAREAGFCAVHVGMGSQCFSPPWYFHQMSLPTKPQEDALARIKKAGGLPVIAAGRMGSLERAGKIIEENTADMVALGRPLIADPDLISKWSGENKDPIQPCGYCLQGCLVRVKKGEGIGCNFNPEVASAEVDKSESPLRVLVAGGGPAGVTTARYLAGRGHEVTLAEKSEKLGGAAISASDAPGKESMANPLRAFFSAAHLAGVNLMLGREVNKDLVDEIRPDLLVWAVGGNSNVPSIPGMDKVNWMTCADFFIDKKEIKGDRVLIVGAGRNGLELAEKLGGQGKEVVATKRSDDLGSFMEPISRKLALARISKDPGISLMPLTSVLELGRDGTRVNSNGEEKRLPPFDAVVICAGTNPRGAPPREIASMVSRIVVIGDAWETADIFSAVKAGYETAMKY